MPKRRANHEGSLYRRKDGRWAAVFGGRTRYAKTEAEARQKWAELKTQALTGGAVSRSTLAATVEELTNRLINPDQAKSTRVQYVAALKHLHPALGSRPIQRLTPGDVRAWLDLLSRNRIGERTRQVAFDLLNRACKHAVTDGLIAKSPCTGQQRPKAPRKHIQPFDAHDAHRILKHVAAHRLGIVYGLTLLGGLRISEALGLRWSRINWKRKVMTIDQAATQSGKVEIKDVLKTSAGHREVPLIPQLLVMLRARLKAATLEGFAEPGHLVIPTGNNTPISRSNFRQHHWAKALSVLQIPYHNIHQTRHTCLTLLLQAGVSPHIVKQIAGHASITTTLDTYGHVLHGDALRSMATLSDSIYCQTTVKPTSPDHSGEVKTKSG